MNEARENGVAAPETPGRHESDAGGGSRAEPRSSLFEAPPLAEQERMVEAILFASAEPVSVADLNARMPHYAAMFGLFTFASIGLPGLNGWETTLRLKRNGEDRPLQTTREVSTRELEYMVLQEQVQHISDVIIRRTARAFNGLVSAELIDEIADVPAMPIMRRQ